MFTNVCDFVNGDATLHLSTSEDIAEMTVGQLECSPLNASRNGFTILHVRVYIYIYFIYIFIYIYTYIYTYIYRDNLKYDENMGSPKRSSILKMV